MGGKEILYRPSVIHKENTMIFTQDIHIDSERCDQHENLRADALFLLMQNAAGRHAERLGSGRAQLIKNRTAWVLTRVSVRMTRWPKWNSTLTLTTAPGAGRAGLYRRYFTFADELGSCGHATSLWTVIDLDKRTIVSADKAPAVPAATDFAPQLPAPVKVRRIEGESTVIPYHCLYTDADLNRHINNAAYIRFLENALPPEKFADATLCELDVCYHREIKPAADVSLLLTQNSDRFYFAVQDGETTAFEAGGRWE